MCISASGAKVDRPLIIYMLMGKMSHVVETGTGSVYSSLFMKSSFHLSWKGDPDFSICLCS